jgi:prevent-host-death family protein
MSSISIVEARSTLADIINNAIYKHKRTIFTRRGKGVVAVIPLVDLELLEALEDKMDAIGAENAWNDAQIHGTMSLAEFKKELGR